MRRKILIAFLVVFVSGLLAGALYLNSLLPVVTGYAAKNLASAVFVSGRDQASFEALELNFSLVRYTSNFVDTINKKVTSRFLWGKSTAIYRKGFGCTIVDDGAEEKLRRVGFPSFIKPLKGRDSLDWPAGDLIRPHIFTGLDLHRLQSIAAELVDEGKYNGHVYAFMILHKGVPVVEKYKTGFNQKSRLLSWSVAKSFTNALAGIMVRDGLLDIYKPADVPGWKADGRKDITINDLLQMRDGLKWNENYGSASDVNLMLHREQDFAGYVAGHPLQADGKPDWNYSSGSTNLICALIRRALKDDDAYYRLAYEQLFHSIGISDAVFEVDATGNFVGSSYIYATARDYARFALLYMQDGVFNGERILPEGWVGYSLTPAEGSGEAYGSSFWLNRNNEFPDAPQTMFYCKGHNGQRIFILPDRQIVVVVFGYSPKPDKVVEFNSLLRDILAAF